MCDYIYQSGNKCLEPPIAFSSRCILHSDISDIHKLDYPIVKEFKDQKIVEKIQNNDFDFEGAKIFSADFSNVQFLNANFRNVTVSGEILFKSAVFNGDSFFDGAKFKDHVNFTKAHFFGYTGFNTVIFTKYAGFGEAIFEDTVSFKGSKFFGQTSFENSTFQKNTEFEESHFKGPVFFDRARFYGEVIFYTVIFDTILSVEDAYFRKPAVQEIVCRHARNNCEKRSDKHEADNYYYFEMEGKRKRKNLFRKTIELPLQYVFFYGVFPLYFFIVWINFVLFFAFIYWIFEGVSASPSLFSSVYFSIVTAMTPGYGGINPKPGIFQGIASIEAIIGTFMWAAFIAIFVRKYAR